MSPRRPGGTGSGSGAGVGGVLARAADVVLDRTVALGFGRPGLVVRRALPGWPADPEPGCLEGRHVLVTGASSGLGIATTEGLARLGAEVHLVVRNEVKGRAAMAAVADRVPGAQLHVRRCDVSDLDDVRRFAATVAEELPEIHGLVHNAGLMPPTRTESPQGHELSMAVHVLGPVLMTELLRERMRGGRVVLVTSGGMYAQALRADDPAYRKGDYSPTQAYARSKRMQVELTPLLADRWSLSGVWVSTMHPGWADTPGVQESLPAFRRLTKPILRDDAEGADTTVWLVGTEPAPPTGRFWHDRRERPTHVLPSTRPDAAEVAAAWAWLRATLDLADPEG